MKNVNSKVIQELQWIKEGTVLNKEAYEALQIAIDLLTKTGCSVCKYEDVEPWDAPCYDCSRNHKDYCTTK